jgi:hypothetical protein
MLLRVCGIEKLFEEISATVGCYRGLEYAVYVCVSIH